MPPLASTRDPSETLDRAAPSAWGEALRAFRSGEIGEGELACAYVADRVRLSAGRRWLQGARPRPHPCRAVGPASRLIAERRLLGVPEVAAGSLVAWAEGGRPVDLLFG